MRGAGGWEPGGAAGLGRSRSHPRANTHAGGCVDNTPGGWRCQHEINGESMIHVSNPLSPLGMYIRHISASHMKRLVTLPPYLFPHLSSDEYPPCSPGTPPGGQLLPPWCPVQGGIGQVPSKCVEGLNSRFQVQLRLPVLDFTKHPLLLDVAALSAWLH